MFSNHFDEIASCVSRELWWTLKFGQRCMLLIFRGGYSKRERPCHYLLLNSESIMLMMLIQWEEAYII